MDDLLKFVQSLGPDAEEFIRQGFARRTNLPPMLEHLYRLTMIGLGRADQIDDPTYDNRAAFLAHALKPLGEHETSEFKGLGDRRLFLRLDPRTLQESPDSPLGDTRTLQPVTDQRLIHLQRLVSDIMNK